MAAMIAGLLRVLVKHINEPIFFAAEATPLGQACTALKCHLASQPSLMPAHVQEYLVSISRTPSLDELQQAMEQVEDEALDSLRPLLLFLQQWCFRQQQDYFTGLHSVSAVFAPLLLPLGTTSGRGAQAQQALAWLIGNAFNIFKPMVAVAAHTHPAPIKASAPAPAPPAQAPKAAPVQATMQHSRSTSSVTAASDAAEAEEQEPWMEPGFLKLAGSLIAATVCSCLFGEVDEEEEEEEAVMEVVVEQEQPMMAAEPTPVITQAAPTKPQLVPLPAMPAWAAPATAMPAASWVELAEQEAGVLCIVRSPLKQVKGSSLGPQSLFAKASLTGFEPRMQMQRSASAPLMSTSDVMALAAVASQLSSMHAMLQRDESAGATSPFDAWRRSCSLGSVGSDGLRGDTPCSIAAGGGSPIPGPHLHCALSMPAGPLLRV
uniref:Rho-GAP domain-containing protein n=1 Tax=Chlamydomonas leiostraca TaxID=1034604 RepID=A0A7S0WPJ0_9CHLO|mmetsp:Transcript_22216/g.56444  ORF Transcript_22216/g.56444 Transcript_22216/m.56444 type:complete len:433 (+) Transcript_22216:227-1525(+)